MKLTQQEPPPSVRDQSFLGTCTSFTVSSCYNCLTPTVRVSAGEFTVLLETKFDARNLDDCKQGLSLGEALKVAIEMGFIEELRLPLKTT